MHYVRTEAVYSLHYFNIDSSVSQAVNSSVIIYSAHLSTVHSGKFSLIIVTRAIKMLLGKKGKQTSDGKRPHHVLCHE